VTCQNKNPKQFRLKLFYCFRVQSKGHIKNHSCSNCLINQIKFFKNVLFVLFRQSCNKFNLFVDGINKNARNEILMCNTMLMEYGYFFFFVINKIHSNRN